MATTPYALAGEQVEPDAGYWSRRRYLCTVTLDDLRGTAFTPAPFNPAMEPEDLEFLGILRDNADDPTFFNNGAATATLTSGTTITLTALSPYFTRSIFIDPNLQGRPPAGAVVSRRTSGPLIVNGVELATLFEGETPGLWHRHVLNVLLEQPVGSPGSRTLGETLSPPRQALYWHLLDAAIDSALAAVWHFKWLATAAGTSPAIRDAIRYRRRPSEAGLTDIVYDRPIQTVPPPPPGAAIPPIPPGAVITRPPGSVRPTRQCPPPTGPAPDPSCPPRGTGSNSMSPGTPRHPAYGSGHSTYSQAASTVMEYILREAGLPTPFTDGWQALADNIGQARFWGGVHWRDDHTFGQALGRAIGERLIGQLVETGVPTPMCILCQPPTTADLEKRECDFLTNVFGAAAAPAPAPIKLPAGQKQFRVDPGSTQGAQG